MLQLVPHLLLRSNAKKSEAAVALRNGNYLVSRIGDDDLAVELATYPHVDALVVELPLFAAIGFANAALAARPRLPLLIIGHAPDVVRRALNDAVATHASHTSELVTVVDLMLARFPLYDTKKAS